MNIKKKAIALGLTLAATVWAGAEEFSITLPKNASLQVGIKSAHFVDFTKIAPLSVSEQGDIKTMTYDLDNNKVYNYRTWRPGGITNAGYFTMSSNASKRPEIGFTDEDYTAYDPKASNTDLSSNGGYETGDIFVNINPQGHLRLRTGESFDAHAMRSWELTDNAINNYFIEPDFHYTVIDTDGNLSNDVISIEQEEGSAWATIRAKAKGTAIVLVTYDGIKLNYYKGIDKKEYLGGEYWGAIWLENTAVYVVSVDEAQSAAVPNMVINEEYNSDALKNAGKNVDAEHDVFYYLDTTPGYLYTFSPENVAEIEIAYPEIGEQSVSYNGFTTEGVGKNEDGSYTILLKNGRQIVRLKDPDGAAAYQVLTAKPCHREVVNLTREGSDRFEAGDRVKIQYTGLRHPANKLAGIYNMSAYITYNGVPNGTSLTQSSAQYTFGSSAAAQSMVVDIPDDYDAGLNGQLILSQGAIQVSGYGDPIGNHRIIGKESGRSPNFNATAHKTYFGALPDIALTSGSGCNGISDSDLPGDTNACADIYDVAGRTVRLQATADDVRTLPSGVYIVRKGNSTRKLVKR